MTTYKDSGVDIEAWDKASAIAYAGAKATFSSRKWMIWEPVEDDWAFAWMLDFWDFYLVQGDDWVWTKVQIAEKINKYDTLGFDLLAMVCDDCICLWAETISITNTLDTNKVDAKIMTQLMDWLSKACIEQKIVIPGWEIAEVWKLVNWNVWNATAVWIVSKNSVISWKNIKVWNKIISLYEEGFRSNWFSLIRYILEKKFWKDVYSQKSSFSEKTWWEELLIPSKIYSWAVLDLIWRFKSGWIIWESVDFANWIFNKIKTKKDQNSQNSVEKKEEKKNWKNIFSWKTIEDAKWFFNKIKENDEIKINWIVHITGWWISWNINRILKRTWFWADLKNLWEPSKIISEIQKLWNVSDDEAYKSWNMSNWMMLFVEEKYCEKIISSLEKNWIKAKISWEVISEKIIKFVSKWVEKNWETLEYNY